MKNRVIKFLQNNPLLIIFLLSVPAIWALFVPGYYGASDDIHIAWLNQFDRALKLGQLPPRYAPDLSYQFGYPLFNFVFPLPFYIAEIFHLLGVGLVDSIKLLFLITVPISGYFMYKLLRNYLSWGLSIIGGLIYIYTPYRSVDLYVRGAIGEILSFVFFPLIVHSLIKLVEIRNLKWAALCGLSAAALILTHNIAAYMFLPIVFVLAVAFLLTNKHKAKLFKLYLYSLLISLLTSCFFWFPAITESKLMKYDTVFNFADHFPTLKQLFLPYWGYGGSVPGPGDGMSFFLGTTTILILFFSLLTIWTFKKIKEMNQKIILVWAAAIFFIAIFMMNFRSSFVWEAVPMIAFFQFPWRFLMLTTFVTPLLLIGIDLKQKWNLIITCALILSVISTMPYFKPQDFLGRSDEYFLNRYIPYPDASEEYKLTQEEYLRLPKETVQRPDKIYPKFYTEGKVEAFKEEKINDITSKAYINSESDLTLNYSRYAYPGWVVRVDGEPQQLQSGKPFGQISIPLSSGSHLVEVYFSETPTKLVLDIISLVTLLFSLYLIFKDSLKRLRFRVGK